MFCVCGWVQGRILNCFPIHIQRVKWYGKLRHKTVLGDKKARSNGFLTWTSLLDYATISFWTLHRKMMNGKKNQTKKNFSCYFCFYPDDDDDVMFWYNLLLTYTRQNKILLDIYLAWDPKALPSLFRKSA